MSDDPFFAVKDDVERVTRQVLEQRAQWNKLLGITDLANPTPHFTDLVNELQNNIETIEYDLQDLEETIVIVEANPHKFRLAPGELAARRSFVANTRAVIQETRAELSGPKYQSKLAADKRKALTQAAKSPGLLAREANQRATNERVLAEGGQDLQQIVKTQDLTLEKISSTVQNLRIVAEAIGEEVDLHNRMLDDLEADVENTTNRINHTMSSMTKVFKDAKSNKSMLVIACLIITIIILAILAVAL
ncbi:hypothetical protein H696_00978 [Fonticula alba]|uniref:t-SNARE coiled-coil homology domain-containing protein n=1 Tax=Fonticula alba TaxID=691883 RepID=A0A058ZIV2_FONAL|nr:hypothetical protein H696_00978 [Fonticula alba]KCV73442.1 hypothetical protein H696_00978 [Fonticula alba]|eukprot:XP_009493143.1 hypothetical protein H696_00978 [Fonticula alba]